MTGADIQLGRWGIRDGEIRVESGSFGKEVLPLYICCGFVNPVR